LPTEENPGGNTFCHWSNPEFDAAFDEANATLDPDVRQEAFQQAAQIMAEERPFIPLYANIRATAHSNRLHGVELAYWQLESSALWDAQNWFVEE
jgi:peptide/nickel transport system substrate-binding protein